MKNILAVQFKSCYVIHDLTGSQLTELLAYTQTFG